MFKISNWENEDLLVIVYNKDEMDIIKGNMVEYLSSELLKEKIDVIGISINLEDIIDESKVEGYIEDLLDTQRITDIINHSLENNFTKFDFEKTDDYYLWIKKQ